MLNTLLVVWRESLEAILVISVLLAWISRQPVQQHLRRGVWLGVGAGITLAALLGVASFAAQSQLQGEALDGFQAGMALLAAAMIVQMVVWMRRHGHTMRQQLEGRAASAGGMLSIATITALAVAREGAETVVFLYGIGMEHGGGQLPNMLAAAVAGLLLALAVSWVISRGARFLNYRTLFLISEVLLLLIANSLLANGIDKLISMDWLPTLLDPAWDSSVLLDDMQGIGRVLADFAGYRARPTGSLALAFAGYWSLIFVFFKQGARAMQVRQAV